VLYVIFVYKLRRSDWILYLVQGKLSDYVSNYYMFIDMLVGVFEIVIDQAENNPAYIIYGPAIISPLRRCNLFPRMSQG